MDMAINHVVMKGAYPDDFWTGIVRRPIGNYVIDKSRGHVTDHVTYPQLVSRSLPPTCRDAIPKSATFIFLFSSSSRFSGFRSLWLRVGGGGGGRIKEQ